MIWQCVSSFENKVTSSFRRGLLPAALLLPLNTPLFVPIEKFWRAGFIPPVCLVVHLTWHWKMVWAPGSEVRADGSLMLCLPHRLSCCFYCLHLLQTLFCKIMQYICKNIHSPARLKTLPCQCAAFTWTLQMDYASWISSWAYRLLFYLGAWHLGAGDAESEAFSQRPISK